MLAQQQLQELHYTIFLPLAVKPSKKWFYVNLNNYRNEHPFLLNKAKIMYKEVIKRQVDLLPTYSIVRLTYTYFPRDRRQSDLGNVCSVHDKFFADALVEAGKLPDDNHKFIPEILFRFGSIDKNHPRVEVLIEEIGESMETQAEQGQMQITLEELEIHEAIRNYVRGQVNIAEDQQIEVDMKAGRSDSGFTATLKISKASNAQAPVQNTKPLLQFGAKPSNISTGEERVEPDDETPVVDNTTASVSSNPFAGDEEETEEENVEPEQEVEAAKAPVEKPKSIFSFSTPKT